MQRSLWKRPLAETAGWLALAAVAFALTYQFDEPLPQYKLGATGWPRVLIILLAFFAVGEFFARMRRMSEHVDLTEAGEGLIADIRRAGITTNIKRVATFLLPVLYLFFLPRMGYYVVTPFFISAYMYLLEERRLFNLTATAFLIYLFTLEVFTKLLFVSLPVGNWPGFYELNSYIVTAVKGL